MASAVMNGIVQVAHGMSLQQEGFSLAVQSPATSYLGGKLARQ